MFAPGEDTFPGIIDIHGLGGGLFEPRASLLANHGFATLALAYYQFEDLPQEPKELHLEYFEDAVNYMLQHPQVGTPLFLVGSCKVLSLCPSHLWMRLQKYSPGRAGLYQAFGCPSSREEKGTSRGALEWGWREITKHHHKRHTRCNQVGRVCRRKPS